MFEVPDDVGVVQLAEDVDFQRQPAQKRIAGPKIRGDFFPQNELDGDLSNIASSLAIDDLVGHPSKRLRTNLVARGHRVCCHDETERSVAQQLSDSKFRSELYG